MEHIIEAVGSLIPGEKFAVNFITDEQMNVVAENMVMDKMTNSARAEIMAAPDGGLHNIASQIQNSDGSWSIEFHWLRLFNPNLKRPTQKEIEKAQKKIKRQVDKAEEVRLRQFHTLADPIRAALTKRQRDMSDEERFDIDDFERYMRGRLTINAQGNLELPPVEHAPIVLPILITVDGFWLTATDNSDAWKEFVEA